VNLFMRQKRSFLVVFAVLCFMFSSIMVASASPKRIGITKFETNNYVITVPGGYDDIGLGASDMLTNELAKNKDFEVVKKKQSNSLFMGRALGASSTIADCTAARIGQPASLDYIVYGKILSAGVEPNISSRNGGTVNQLTVKVQIAVRMIDTSTGSIVWADKVNGQVKESGEAIQGISSIETDVPASVYDEAVEAAIKKIVTNIKNQSQVDGYLE
jgi:curli biogenesis system outer membrane secretion channel CsgG